MTAGAGDEGPGAAELAELAATRVDEQCVAWWAAACLLCLSLHASSFFAWFRGDDFAWLGLAARVHGARDFWEALFRPAAQGTLRPLSERAFFIATFHLFGVEALPFRVVIFATQFANLALMIAIGKRLAGCAAAGFLAAVLWLVNSATIEPLGWTCVYNQVLSAFFLLLAFYFLLRLVETGETRYEVLEWFAFLLGFGAHELNLTYPAVAAAYTWLFARPQLRRVLPMFGISTAYVAAHWVLASGERGGEYALHFTGSMLRTLGKYWIWTVGPWGFHEPIPLPAWVLAAGAGLISIGLLAAPNHRLAFGGMWWVITLAPVLPLRDHMMGYYLFIPAIGLCWAGGWAVMAAWRMAGRKKTIAAALTSLYILMAAPRTVVGTARNYSLTMRVRSLVEGVAEAHELHPGRSILLDGIDTDLFWNGILDHPFRVVGIPNVYLTPGSERLIQGDAREFIVPAAVAVRALQQGAVEVYDTRGRVLGNITTTYAKDRGTAHWPPRIDVGNPLSAYLLGPEWYGEDDGHRWMGKRATIRIGAPERSGEKLYLRGWCGAALQVRVWANGRMLGARELGSGEPAFELQFALPDSEIGKPEMTVAVEVDHTFRQSPDQRDLGLAFGVVEVR